MENEDVMTDEEYEIECKKQEQRNEKFLKIFENDLMIAGLSKTTIGRHSRNVQFYINTYLLREVPLSMECGCNNIDMFLGYFFIRKYGRSTPNNIRKSAASIKKYYQCMLKHGYIEKEDYDYLCSEIKEHMEEWQEDCINWKRSVSKWE